MAEPTQRRAETRQRILTAAGHLFREHGVDGVGVDAVMKQAGLTHGGFYLHFPSKEALAAEVSQSLLEQAAKRWDRLSRSGDRRRRWRRIVRQLSGPGTGGLRALLSADDAGPDVARRAPSREAVGGALRAWSTRWPAVCRGGSANGRWRRCPPWWARWCWPGLPMIRPWPRRSSRPPPTAFWRGRAAIRAGIGHTTGIGRRATNGLTGWRRLAPNLRWRLIRRWVHAQAILGFVRRSGCLAACGPLPPNALTP